MMPPPMPRMLDRKPMQALKTTPRVRLVPRLRLWAATSGWKPSSAMTSLTMRFLASVTDGCPLTTRETVPTDTPAFLATSRIVVRGFTSISGFGFAAYA